MIDPTKVSTIVTALNTLCQYATTMSYLINHKPDTDTTEYFIIELREISELNDFHFHDEDMQEKFIETAKSVADENNLFVSLQQMKDADTANNIDAISLTDLADFMNVMAILASDKKDLAFYSQLLSPTISILTNALHHDADSAFAHRAYTTAITTVHEIESQIMELQKDNSDSNP